MNSKNKSKSSKISASKKYQKPSKKFASSIQSINKLIPLKKNTFTIKSIQNKKPKKLINNKINNIIAKHQNNDEDSSTNFLSGFNYKKNNNNINLPTYLNNAEKEEKYIVSESILKKRESKTESFFINFQLGEKDPFIDSIFKNDSKYDNQNSKKFTLKNNYYNYGLNKGYGKGDNDSLELYDFNDDTNVEFILKNISYLNENKSRANNISIIFENIEEISEDNDKEKEKIVGDIKIFDVKKSIFNLNSKS